MANNYHAWGEFYKIIYAGLFIRFSLDKKWFSIIIKFTTLYYANRAIKTGTI